MPRNNKAYKLFGKSEGTRPLRKMRKCRNIKMILRKQDVGWRLDSSGSEYEPVANSCGYGNEPSSSHKRREISLLTEWLLEWLCSMELDWAEHGMPRRKQTALWTDMHITNLSSLCLCYCLFSYAGYKKYTIREARYLVTKLTGHRRHTARW
jgi:hypothetical protein